MNTLKLTEEVRKEIVEKYQAGVNIPSLEIQMRLSRVTISKALKEAGIQPQRQDGHFTPVIITPELQATLTREYKLGKSIKKLQDEYKVPYKRIVQLVDEEGIEKESRPVPKETREYITANGQKRKRLGEKEQQELVSSYINDSVSKEDLAKQHDVSVLTVTNILDKNQVPSRKLVNEELEQELCDEFNKGMVTIYDLARMFKLNPGLIRYCLAKNGISTDQQLVIPAAGKIKQMIKGNSVELIQGLIDTALDPTAEKRDSIKATEILLDRGFGKSSEEKEDEDPNKKKEEGEKGRLLKMVPPNVRLKIDSNTSGNK